MPKQLHILISAYACLPNKGTELGNGWNWPHELAKRGMRVHVLTVTEGRKDIEAYRKLHPEPRVTFSYVSVPPRLRHTSGLHYAFWQFAAVRVARGLHQETPFDLAHHVTYSSVHVPTQLWRLGIPTIFGPVGGGQVAPRGMLGAFGQSRRSEIFRTALTKMLRYSPWHRRWLQKMTIVLATNSDTLRLVKNLGMPRVEPWFDAALPESFFPSEPRRFSGGSGPLRLLWVGKMVPRKAFPLALDVMTRLPENITLTVAGGGLPEQEVRRMIAERGLTERVRWAGGLLEWTAMREAYLQHDALLFVSLRDSCPAQLVEAMGLALPVITLDHHGARDLVPSGAGIKVPVTTPQRVLHDLAHAVAKFDQLTNEQRNTMAQEAWTFARTLTYAAGAELFEKIYREILDGCSDLTALPQNAAHMREPA